MECPSNTFQILNKIDCSEHTEKKNDLTYLSWAWAWTELKKLFPRSYYTVYENASGLFYHTDGSTCWVKTGVTLVDNEGVALEHIEYLPVMDFRNKSIPLDKITSFDVNKAIQRSLTKAVARHGLGLYIYAGEDLPEGADEQKPNEQQKPAKPSIVCSSCHKPIPSETLINGKRYSAEDIAATSRKKYGIDMCYACKRKADAGDSPTGTHSAVSVQEIA